MTDAPGRIWAARGLYDHSPDVRHPTPIEYVHIDLFKAMTAERDAQADTIKLLVEAVEHIANTKPHHAGQTPNEYHMQQRARKALALIDKGDTA